MNKRILIAEDEEDMRKILSLHLNSKGYEVLEAKDGIEAVDRAKQNIDLILLDIMMPGMDGLQVCKKIRSQVACPIIFISAASNDMNKMKAFSLGGDDFISKPFSLKELMYKIEALFKMKERLLQNFEENKRQRMIIDDLLVDISSREMMYNKQVIPFTKKEFDLLVLLLSSPKQIFTKDQIYESISGIDGQGDANSIVEHIKNVRSKLSSAGFPDNHLQTVWGIGYQWNNR
ncbi:response regulator transcription factor [Peribacillus simplex]|uniref:Response regulator transcription factor n=2 Tax=Peribacillus TaxID=2675229 RepID=A0AA90P719_9BACI|nr:MULTISPECIES: response regulator transcription factor [Peribacillus]MDP1421856.1 response regulator transcription factor [Peribacillus simplex]MDP1454508.1 response regulator transcription factor [Peribacillus frigoritolerans]